MKLLALNGSMRKKGNTVRLITHVAEQVHLACPGAELEVVHAADLSVQACRVSCAKHCLASPFQCVLEDDLADLLQRMARADALLLASPLYIVIPAVLNTLLERLVALAWHAEERSQSALNPLAGKPCGLITVAEYTDPIHVLEHLHKVALVLGMRPVRIAAYPYLGISGQGNLEDRGPLRPLLRSGDLARELLGALRSP